METLFAAIAIPCLIFALCEYLGKAWQVVKRDLFPEDESVENFD